MDRKGFATIVIASISFIVLIIAAVAGVVWYRGRFPVDPGFNLSPCNDPNYNPVLPGGKTFSDEISVQGYFQFFKFYHVGDTDPEGGAIIIIGSSTANYIGDIYVSVSTMVKDDAGKTVSLKTFSQGLDVTIYGKATPYAPCAQRLFTLFADKIVVHAK